MSILAGQTVFVAPSKMVKAMGFKFDRYVPNDSPDMTPCKFCKRGRGRAHVTTTLTSAF